MDVCRAHAQLLSELLGELLTTRDPDIVIRAVYDRVANYLDVDAYFHFMVNEKGDALILHSYSGISEETAAVISRIEFGQNICGSVALTRKPIVACDIQNTNDEKADLARKAGIQACVCSPLMFGNQLLGTLAFATRSRTAFTGDELELITTVCKYVSIAMERLHADRALRESEERFRTTFDNAAVAIAHVALNGRLIRFNELLCTITGYRREELAGSKLDDITRQWCREIDSGQMKQLLAKQISGYETQKRCERKDGSVVWVNITISLMYGHDGAPENFIYVIEDISARIEAEAARIKAEALFRTLAEGMPDMAWVMRPDGEYEYLNPQWYAFTGWKESEFSRDKLAELVHPDDLERVRSIQQEVLTSLSDYEVEFRYRRADGEWRWVDSRSAPVKDAFGNIHHWVGTLTDIHDRRMAEENLKHLNDELEIARDSALEASEAKSLFLSNMSHELRTPLNAILGYTEMVKEDLASVPDTEQQIADLGKIETAGLHLLSLVSDVLDLGRIEAGQFSLRVQSFPLIPAVREVVSFVETMAYRNGNIINLECDTDHVGNMVADEQKVRQILTNLLVNAAKFTHNGSIRVAIEREQESHGAADRMLLTVSDSGIGIAKDQMNNLFRKFTQGDNSRSKRYGGIGLGLYISQRLSEIMGGTITAKSEVGVGTTFTVRLPVDASIYAPVVAVHNPG